MVGNHNNDLMNQQNAPYNKRHAAELGLHTQHSYNSNGGRPSNRQPSQKQQQIRGMYNNSANSSFLLPRDGARMSLRGNSEGNQLNRSSFKQGSKQKNPDVDVRDISNNNCFECQAEGP